MGEKAIPYVDSHPQYFVKVFHDETRMDLGGTDIFLVVRRK